MSNQIGGLTKAACCALLCLALMALRLPGAEAQGVEADGAAAQEALHAHGAISLDRQIGAARATTIAGAQATLLPAPAGTISAGPPVHFCATDAGKCPFAAAVAAGQNCLCTAGGLVYGGHTANTGKAAWNSSAGVASKQPMPMQPAPVSNQKVIRVSLLGLVRHCDIVVKAVMAFLLLCSTASWAAFVSKSFVLACVGRNTRAFSIVFRNAATMDDAEAELSAAGDGPAWQMLLAARAEWEATLAVTGTPLAAHQINRLLQRLALAMGSVQERALSRLGSWMGLLATVGSTAPFIGLFGTVWGILDSFEHISASYNTSLTVVAPGIAEALLATAVGLFTAIPATMFYNRFAREIGKVTGMLDNVSAELIVFASRDVERLGK